MMYVEDELLASAIATADHWGGGSGNLHKNSNGNIVTNGNTIVLIKSFDVKGSTEDTRLRIMKKNVRLVANDAQCIEGEIKNQRIVILTKYLRNQGA